MTAKQLVDEYRKKFEETGSDLWYFELAHEESELFQQMATISSCYDIVKMKRDRWERIEAAMEALL